MTEKNISGEQYFTANPNAEHHYQNFDFDLLGHELHFTTDSGVFSKSTVDFGTRTMLDALEKTSIPIGKVLDLGTGYGPVGLTVAKAYQRHVDMVDVNERALDLARKNAQQNGVAQRVNIFKSDVYASISDKYALILVNPPIRAGKQVVTAMLQESANYLQDGGKLIAVLQKKQGAPSAQKNMSLAFGNAKVIHKNKGYYILESTYGTNTSI
ncbi:16S RNA G1207 methylase RsmC [Leuconostoc mesenteroides subsp. dextranicum]|uniref:class I SAM-dependent methyltransferase n=1 Tax=Leuconostoc mesenteroides TaxID=1245 RepID=UPI0024A55A8A|nr:methyltransferase [Leuconostoc mesenteroides]GLX32469.1 16S RNA G1207 methylase RsmC [Leuconostoc mesenteroides subsp. dextranicum]